MMVESAAGCGKHTYGVTCRNIYNYTYAPMISMAYIILRRIPDWPLIKKQY